jgi:uncharacterized GH25 family protein
MKSNARPVVVALAASALIVSAVLVGGLLFVLNNNAAKRDQPADNVAALPGDVPAPAVPSEKVSELPPVAAVVEKKEETLVVRVVEKESRRPLREASIVVKRDLVGDQVGDVVYPSGGKRSVQSGGEFQVKLLPGAYRVWAFAPSYSSVSELVTIAEGLGKNVELALTKGLTISGRVLDKDRKPIAAARVAAFQELGGPDDSMIEKLIKLTEIVEMTQEPVKEQTTAPDGTYTIDGLKLAYYKVTAAAGGFTPLSRGYIRPTAQNVDFILPAGSELPGVVIDFQGSPIAGALVQAYPEVESNDIFAVISTKSRPPIETAETDSAGKFVLTSLGSGKYNFIVEAPRHQPGRFQKIAVYEGKNSEQTFSLKPGLVLAGKIVDQDGNGIPGAWIKPTRTGDVRDQNIHISFKDGRIQAGADGHFEFNTLEEGNHSLLAWHDDYAAKQVRDVELGNTGLTISLTRGGDISGKVVEAGTGEPIAGARIQAGDLLDLKKSAITDESGLYVVRGLSGSGRGKRYLAVEAAGYARISNHTVNVEEGRVTENVNFELARTAMVSGSVVNSAGKTVERARIMARRKGANTQVPITVGSAVTEADGSFRIDSVEAGAETWLTVMSSEYLEAESNLFSIAPGEQLDIGQLLVTLGGSIAGVVVDPEGRGVAGASVAIRGESDTEFNPVKTATTDNRGQFRVAGLDAGQTALQAKSTQFLDAVVEGVVVQEGQETREVRIQLRRGNRIAGLIVDHQDRPVRNARIKATEIVSGIKEHQEFTDNDGKFAFNGLLSDGTVTLAVEHNEYSPYASNDPIKIGSEDVLIRLQPLGGVRGLVVDAAGNPVPSFIVQPIIQASEGAGGGAKPASQSRTFQSEDGAFEYKGLAAGTYKVAVSAPSFSAVTVPEVVVSSGEISDVGRIALQEGGIIDGYVVEASSGRPIAGAQVSVIGGSAKFLPTAKAPEKGQTVGNAFTDDRGFFEFRQLRDGDVTVRVRHDGYAGQQQKNVNTRDAATCRNLRVALEVGGTVSGVVLDAKGSPMKNMKVYLTGSGDLAKDSSVNQHTTTDAEGRFAFQALAHGSYKVTAHDFKLASRPSVEFEISPAQASIDAELVFED